MRKVLLSLVLLTFAAGPAVGQVVISQVNGNGGLGTDPFDRDFVELFNRGPTPVDLSGWSLQLFGDFGSATTVATPAWDVIPLSGTILPGQYFLVAPSFQRGSLGSSVTTDPLPSPDVMGPVYDGAVLVTAVNAVALMSSTTPIPAGQCPGGPDLVDLFRVGHPNALCFEGTAPAGPPGSGSSTPNTAYRNDMGCTDTDNNVADITTQQLPNPRNSDLNVFVLTSIGPGPLVTGTGGIVTLTATLGPAPCNPLPGALTAVEADLSAFGLAADQDLFDDGAHGDLGPNDGVFGFSFLVEATQQAGAYVVPMLATSGATTLPASARLRVFPLPAPNDACENAINLTGPSIDITVDGPYTDHVNTTMAASEGIDAGSCNGDNTGVNFSVWYRFTAPADGALRITENSTEDIVSSRHDGCGLASSICMNREDGGFPVLAGQTYWIQIGRETASLVTPQVPLEVTFTWMPVIFQDIPCFAEIISGFPYSDQPFAPSATDEPFNISCDAAANPGARHGVWYTFTLPDDGALLITENSINPTNFTIFTSATDCNGVSPGQCVDESISSGALLPGLTAGTQYWLLVSYDSSVTASTPSQPYNFTINFLPTPDNDLCTGAIDLNEVGLPFADTVLARAATGDSGVPTGTGTGINGCGTTLGTRPNGVWYRYTTGPGADGTLRVAEFTGTTGGTNDVFYNVFTGGEDCTLGLVADQCAGVFSNDDIFIQLAPDTTYYILVGMQTTTASASGDYELTFTLHPTPENDEPCNAISITETPFNFSPVGPSYNADVDVTCNYTIPAQSTTGFGGWYHFNVPTEQQLFVHNVSSDVLVFGLFTGPDCNTLSEVDCKMGSNGALTTFNAAFFNLEANTDYWLLMGKIASSAPFGFYNINFELTDAKGGCCDGADCSIGTDPTCSGVFGGPFTTCAEVPQYEDIAFAPIPDATSGAGGTPGVLTRTINVTDVGNVTDIKVLVDLVHGRVGDLIITLNGPNGFTQDLIRRIDDDDDQVCPNFNQQGRLTDLGGVYIFDDQAYNPYGPTMHASAKYFDFTGLVVLPGHYLPTTCNDVVVSLNDAFVGSPINGDWTLTITDNQNSGGGSPMLNRWGLIINYGADPTCGCEGDLDGNGLYDGLDIAPFVQCVLTGTGEACDCADLSGNGTPGLEDVELFVDLLIGG